MTVWLWYLVLVWVADPSRLELLSLLIWPVVLVLTLGSIVVAVFYDGVFAIDRPLRRPWRTAPHGSHRGRLRRRRGRAGCAGRRIPADRGGGAVRRVRHLLFQPVWRRLERWADRWVFGARLDGYEVLTRFGATLESAPGPAELLPEIADVVRHGLDLRWARVVLDLPGSTALTLPRAREPTMPPSRRCRAADPRRCAARRIECGPRPDGPLLDEDRALLGHLAGQAAAAVSNLHWPPSWPTAST
jgi:hypothetical protein